MRGDQLARKWRVARAIEASSNGLTVAKFVKRGETGKSTIDRNMENPQTDGSPPPLQQEGRSGQPLGFRCISKFKIPVLFFSTPQSESSFLRRNT